MRRLRVVAAACLVLVVSGCVPDAGIPTLPPTPTVTPVFASEEEALAAAEDAYAAYLEMSDLIASEGGNDPERLAPFVTEEQFERELQAIARYSDQGWHAEGRIRFDSMTLQQMSQNGDVAELAVYVCADVTDVQLLDDSGVDVTPDDRADRVSLEVLMEARAHDDILIAGSEAWSGDSFC